MFQSCSGWRDWAKNKKNKLSKPALNGQYDKRVCCCCFYSSCFVCLCRFSCRFEYEKHRAQSCARTQTLTHTHKLYSIGTATHFLLSWLFAVFFLLIVWPNAFRIYANRIKHSQKSPLSSHSTSTEQSMCTTKKKKKKRIKKRNSLPPLEAEDGGLWIFYTHYLCVEWLILCDIQCYCNEFYSLTKNKNKYDTI